MWGSQCPFVNILVWEESRADYHVLIHSEVECRPSILTGYFVKAVHACNSMARVLFANFALLFSSLSIYALIHHKCNTSFSGFACLRTIKNGT